VREYTRAQRNVDLVALGVGQQPQRAPPPALEIATPDAEETHHSGKGHKRKREKERRQLEEQEKEGEGLDETLLAVIGILHAARLQSSIAGWLRAGVLFRSKPREDSSAQWFDDPALVHDWARRGREAMRELGLPIEHGVRPDP